MKAIARARVLRSSMTDAERKLWSILRDRRLNGYKFRRQVPVEFYVIDFACAEAWLAVEVDGGQHCDNVRDAKRTAWLENQGWHMLRFWNNAVLQQTEAVTETLLLTIRARIAPNSPLPAGEVGWP